MLFLIERIHHRLPMYIDYKLIMSLFHNNSHEYKEMSVTDFFDFENNLLTKKNFPSKYQDAIPIGTIQFVNLFLKVFKGIEEIPVIEVPKCLQTDYFLKREYRILPYDQIPTKGKYFIKNVSHLKTLTYIGDMKNVIQEINKADMYQVSDILDIKSEYRVYVIDGKIYAIENYNGDPTLFPDINLIKQANMRWSLENDYPKSYTMDVAVTEQGTCLLECHVLFACGIYTNVLGDDFLQGYIDGIKYIERICKNTKTIH